MPVHCDSHSNFSTLMADAPRNVRAQAAKPWPDRWLSEAATRRGLPGSERLMQFTHMATAWQALVAAGAAEQAVLDLACLVSATKPADLSRVGPAEAALMARGTADKFGVVPVRLDGAKLVVASPNPLSSTLERDLAIATGKRIDVVTASPSAVSAASRRMYADPTFALDPALTRFKTPTGVRAVAAQEPPRQRPAALPMLGVDELDDRREAAEAPASAVIDQIFAEALREQASDVQLEPKEDGVLVRFRVDGSLYDARRLSAEQGAQVARQLKLLAKLDAADVVHAQSGQASLAHEGRVMDIRVSTTPRGGVSERVVVRILDPRITSRDLDAIGYTAKQLASLKRLLELPEGIVLVAGPAGSGKTSTLYAALRQVARADAVIASVEDPIEYRIGGVNQLQVNERTGTTFGAALRSVLRERLDVLLVGEMRDTETASVAVEAAAKGPLVLSALNATDALGALDRMQSLGLDATALGAALEGIVAQRLIRKLCDDCAQPVAPSELPAHQQQLLHGRQTALLRRPVGCPRCRGTGYHGRTLVAEIFMVTPLLKQAISGKADSGTLGQIARDEGMTSMWESGLERVLGGTTSLYELLDNFAPPIVAAEAGSAQTDIDAMLAELLAPTIEVSAPAPSSPAAPAISAPSEMEFLRSLEIDDVVIRATPASAPAIVSAEPPQPPSAAASAAPPARPSTPSAALRVLVVDEDQSDRRRLADALTREGMTVLEASDGESALAYVRRLKPDVIITEAVLPRLDAIGLLQAMSDEALTARVFVYTRQTDPALHGWLRELGTEAVIPRTVDAEVIAARLRARVSSAA